MKPGREFDAWIHNRVMGRPAVTSEVPSEQLQGLKDYLMTTIPNYSTKFDDAWKLVHRINELSESASFELKQTYDGVWSCRMGLYNGREGKSTGYILPEEAIAYAAFDLFKGR